MVISNRFNNPYLFTGEFLNGVRHGDGLFTYSNKDIYSGCWKNGKKHGMGTYIFSKQGGEMKVISELFPTFTINLVERKMG